MRQKNVYNCGCPLHNVRTIQLQTTEGNVLDIQIFINSMAAALSTCIRMEVSDPQLTEGEKLLTQSTLFDTAEWNHSLADSTSVGAHHSDLKRLGDPPNSPNVPREEVSREADGRVVSELDDLLLGFELHKRGEWSECLLLTNHRVAGDVSEDCRSEEGPCAVETLATMDELGAAVDSVLNVALDLFDGPLVNQRPVCPRKISCVGNIINSEISPYVWSSKPLPTRNSATFSASLDAKSA